jgi:hypothetical protein
MYDFDETGLDKTPADLNKYQRAEYDRLMEDRNKYQFDEFNNPRFDSKEPIKRHQLYNAYLYADHMTQTAKNKIQKHVQKQVDWIKNIINPPKDSAEPMNESLEQRRAERSEEIRMRNKNKQRSEQRNSKPAPKAWYDLANARIIEQSKTEVQDSNNKKTSKIVNKASKIVNEPVIVIPQYTQQSSEPSIIEPPAIEAIHRNEVIHELVRQAEHENENEIWD